MPYPKEIASGESLRFLESSPEFQKFKGTILPKEGMAMPEPKPVQIARRKWIPKSVIAIDGSNITAPLNRQFPVAEAGLVIISAVAIDLNLLRKVPLGEIPRPKVFHEMENPGAFVKGPVPGDCVVHKDTPNDSPVNFFRRTVHEIFANTIPENPETLLDTLRGMEGINPRGNCPAGCDAPFELGKEKCRNCGEKWYEIDALRLHEPFNEAHSSQEAHGRLRNTLEIFVLLNILRFFAKNCPQYFADCLFVLDGPLAIFGAPASILRPVRKELMRLNQKSQEVTGQDIALIGVEKTGILSRHWEQVDFDEEKGPRSRYHNNTIILPDSEYIRKNIKFNKQAYGDDTHFGRFVLYKTNKGKHVVLNTAMLSERSQNFADNDMDCFHRLGDALDVMDELATYLYQDAFIPLVRAHANAAIPLKRGFDIIKNLFEDK